MEIGINYKDNKIFFESNEDVSNSLKIALMLDSNFWIDIQREFRIVKNETIVRTEIICKDIANPEKMFELKSVRDCFKGYSKIYFFDCDFVKRISHLPDGFLT